ncbi:MAG: S16 family serine protease [Candidatus Diapherotrites archaeon]
MRKQVILLAILLLISVQVQAVLSDGSMKIFAVTTQGEGLSATLILEIEPGDGNVYSAITPLVGTTTQNAEREAVRIARNYSTEAGNYDYKFHIISDASVVEGPSAGSAMTLLTISLLQGRNVPKNVSVTGTITPDGFVGPVGGVFEKAKEAARQGIKLFMIPEGEANQTVKNGNTVESINLIEYGPKEWGMKIVEVKNIDQLLELAHSDIGDIEVTQGDDDFIPSYIPDPISFPENLMPLKNLNRTYLLEANQWVQEARNSVSTTLLDDTELINVLLKSLNNSEKTLEEAQLLDDQNYLYSAANYAFLAKVNAMFVKDISDNPSIVSPDSSFFESKITILKQNILDLKDDLDESIPTDKLEWHIAAKQRLTYAEASVDELLNTRTVVVGGGGIDYAEAFARIEKYEFAREWYTISNRFYGFSRDSNKKVLPNNVFEVYMDDLIRESENGLTIIDGDQEDILRRLNAAKAEKEMGWYLASTFDAASSFALVSSEIQTRDADLNSLYLILNQKIAAIDANISASEREYIWARLYLDHAKYFLESADFYSEQGYGSNAVNSLKSGIDLAFLAEAVLEVSDDMYEYYEGVPSSEFIIENNVRRQGDIMGDPDTILLIFGGIFLAVMIFTIVLFFFIWKIFFGKDDFRRHYSLASEIARVKELKRKTDEGYAIGRVTIEKHSEMSALYDEELKKLEGLLKHRTEHVFEIDRLRAELAGWEFKLQELEKHFLEGLIEKGEYRDMKERYALMINEIGKELKGEKLEMAIEKEKLIKLAHENREKTLPRKKKHLPGKKKLLPKKDLKPAKAKSKSKTISQIAKEVSEQERKKAKKSKPSKGNKSSG